MFFTRNVVACDLISVLSTHFYFNHKANSTFSVTISERIILETVQASEEGNVNLRARLGFHNNNSQHTKLVDPQVLV